MSIQSTTQKTPIVDKGLDAATIKKAILVVTEALATATDDNTAMA